MLSIFKPAPHKARVADAEVDPLYRRLRWQIFLGIFFGYAAYYLVRKNFALAMPYLVEQGFSRGDLGFALSGISIAYGFSKFIMGSVSDRSNPRVFLPAGLILAAAVMLFMGFVPWATSSIMVMFVLLFLCGLLAFGIVAQSFADRLVTGPLVHTVFKTDGIGKENAWWRHK